MISKLVVVLSIKSKLNFDLIDKNIIVIKLKMLENLFLKYLYFLSKFFKEIIGVTGTNGKTTVLQIIKTNLESKKN